MTAQAEWDDLSRRIAELCVRIPASAGPAVLARELAGIAPELAFREVLARGGWYRLGGVVDAGGTPVADDLEQWAEAELAARDDDMGALCDAYAGRGLHATRLSGRTHYFVAACGPGATDFVQLEIEELQELVCHPLFDGEALPGGIEELVDPRGADANCRAASRPLGAPFLALRRLTPMRSFLARMASQKPEPQPVHRFIEAWESSSAGAATQFSNHWVLAVREHLDRYRQSILHATPVAALNGAPPKFAAAFGLQGLALHDALARYDKAAGYPMAWFFHMLTTRSAPHALAGAVIDDVQAGFHYLPDRDVAVVKDWLYRPYGF
ncbi:MAG: hypothetical protein FD157_378 [Rhodocyclaceae bacterium]|nr:MAG: hypothetical protein FD157_378 [Rhodocyclaceae bacterium]TNC99092.1 MAG: hypothetical protein FD118_3890 [Rhodocyclaceae bacterium]